VRFLEQALDGDVKGDVSAFFATPPKGVRLSGWAPFTLSEWERCRPQAPFFLADTEGNKTWIVREGGGFRPQILSSDRPVTVIPRNGGSFLVVGRSGDIGEASLDATGHLSGDVTPMGSLGTLVADAVSLSGTTFCVADWGSENSPLSIFPLSKCFGTGRLGRRLFSNLSNPLHWLDWENYWP
jgi:hypothetical protein